MVPRDYVYIIPFYLPRTDAAVKGYCYHIPLPCVPFACSACGAVIYECLVDISVGDGWLGFLVSDG